MLENAVQKVLDDSLRENATNAGGAGLEVRVTRTYDGKGLSGGRECHWCLDRCGENMTLNEAYNKGAFQRHPGCGCEIEYTTKKGAFLQKDWRHNVWERRHTDNRQDAIRNYQNSFTKAETIDDAKKFAQEKLGVELSNYDSINLELANRTNFEIQKAYDAFGDLHKKGVLDGVRVLNGEGPEAAYCHAMKEVFYYKNKVAYKSSIGKMRETAIENHKYGFWSTSSEMHGIRHELGHAVRYTISERQYKKIDAIRNEILGKTGISEWSMYDSVENRKVAGKYLSYYGLKDTDEFIAECVAEFMAGNPRKTATDVIKIIRGR